MPKKNPRKLTHIRFGKDGVPTHYKIKGNTKATPVKTVAKMAEKGCIKDVHPYDLEHVRSNPDSKTKNNLHNLPEF